MFAVLSHLGKYLLLASVAFYLLGAFCALLFRTNGSRKLPFLFCAAGAVSGVLLAASVLAGGESISAALPQTLPFEGGLAFVVDPLSAVFIGIISIVSFPLSVYTIGYSTAYQARKNAWLLGFAQNLFVLSMLLVVSANNALLFFILWEIMSLLSYFLVNFESEKTESNRAGFTYLAITHIGAAFILLSFMVLFHFSGSFAFDSFRTLSNVPPFYLSLAFVFALIGFGTKTGMIPMHLQDVIGEATAPNNISALMSGAMVKAAVYMLIRFVFEFLGGGFLWWGLLVLGLGVVSAVLGVLYALAENDLKRLLAYSTVENVGIILMGLGASVIFFSSGARSLASLALVATILHALNHAFFKSLLFIGAGSVGYSAHTNNLEELGGLIKKMPWTAFFFLIGAVSISALPFFNGFVGEWLLFQSLLAGTGMPSLIVKILLPIAGAMLALTGGLAALCFVKAFGITFLGNARSAHAEHAREVPATMRFGMGFLAAGCFILGIFPVIVLSSLGPVTTGLFGNTAEPVDLISPFGGASISPLLLLLVFISVIPCAIILSTLIGGKTTSRRYVTWDCGFAGLGAKQGYSSTAYAQPARAVFAGVYDQNEEVHQESGIISSYSLTIGSLFERYLYSPAASGVLRIAGLLQKMQTGSTRTYLVYIFATLVLLLIAMRWL